MIGDQKGNVKAIEIVKTRLGEYDNSGRRKPVLTDEIQRFDCDSVIFAIGESVDLDFARASGLRLKESGTIEVDRFTLETSRPHFLLGAMSSPAPPMFPMPWPTGNRRPATWTCN